jgi:hypothetical protein
MPCTAGTPSYIVYRVIRKSLCTWWLQYGKLQVIFKVSPSSLQTFINTRLTLPPSVIPNSNYVIMVSDWNCLKYFCVFLYCNHQVHRDFLITLYLPAVHNNCSGDVQRRMLYSVDRAVSRYMCVMKLTWCTVYLQFIQSLYLYMFRGW